MANWNKIFDAYESNDCESLGEYAYEYLNTLLSHFRGKYANEDAVLNTIMCAEYFIAIDNFYDGGEQDVIASAWGHDWAMNWHRYHNAYRQYGWQNTVESEMRNAPYRVQEAFARLGCAICAGKGYISEQERRVILKWV